MVQFSYKSPTSEDFLQFEESKTPEEKLTNIPQHVLDTLKEIGSRNRVVTITRPVNPDALLHLKRFAAGKNMAIHGKSADYGPVRGLIPVNINLSKADQKDQDKIKKLQASNKEALAESDDALKKIHKKLEEAATRFTPGEVIIEEEFLEKANLSKDSFDPVIQPVKLQTKNGDQIVVFENEDGQVERDIKTGTPIYAIKAPDGTYQRIGDNHEILGPYSPSMGYSTSDVEVFGKPSYKIDYSTGKITFTQSLPITADVDILAFGAYIDLTAQDVSHSEDIVAEREKLIEREKLNAIKESGLDLNKEWQDRLVNMDLSKESMAYLQSLGENGQELIAKLEAADAMKFKEHELAHLKTYGTASDPTRALVGVLRDDLAAGEISHAPEQSNYFATQPLDGNWVMVDSQQRVSVIKGEENLIKVFTNAYRQGMSMAPNPNWGWRFDTTKDAFVIDPQLKEMNKYINGLMHVETDDPRMQQDILALLDARLSLGKLAIKTDIGKENSNELALQKVALQFQVSQYKDKHGGKKVATSTEIAKWISDGKKARPKRKRSSALISTRERHGIQKRSSMRRAGKSISPSTSTSTLIRRSRSGSRIIP